MAVEIGTLVLKGRFGPAREAAALPREALEEAFALMRQELLQAMDDKLETAERRARER